MKTRATRLSGSIAILIFLFAVEQGFAQRPVIVNKAILPEVQTVADIRVDDDVTRPASVPRADLVVQEMCFEQNKGGLNAVNVLLANVGTVDAGPFELGFRYIASADSSRFALDRIEGLKVGEQLWVKQFHSCCGLAASMLLVDWATKYEAIADAKYYKPGSLPYTGTWVSAVIPESNESNNKLLRNKSDLRPCSTLKNITTPMKQVRPVRP
jgi:hypothetical protein